MKGVKKMERIFVGEFSEEAVKFGKKIFTDSLRKLISDNPNYKRVEMDLVESKGHSYYFRNLRVYIVVEE